jgi:hypothetical protein
MKISSPAHKQCFHYTQDVAAIDFLDIFKVITAWHEDSLIYCLAAILTAIMK